MAHHWQKLKVEELLFESGLAHIILQPAPYLQNILAYIEKIIQNGVYSVPYDPKSRISMVDLAEVAEAASILLGSSKFNWGVYELAGTEPLSQIDVAAVLSQRLGIEIRVEQMTLDNWRQYSRKSGLEEYQIEALVSMFRYYDRFGLKGNKQVLGWILGREPAQLSQFVNDVIEIDNRS